MEFQGIAEITQALPDAVVVIDEDGRLKWGNTAAERLMGVSVAAGVGRSPLEFVHPEDVGVVTSSLASIRGKEVGTPIEVRVRADDGWRLVELVGANLFGHPTIDGLVLSLRDLTERRRWEVARDEVSRFRALVHNASVIMMLLDADTRVVSVSAAITRLLGYDQEDVEGLLLTDLVVEHDRNRLSELLSRVHTLVSAAGPVTLEVEMASRDGSKAVPFELKIVNLLDDPTVGGLVVTGHDVTRLRESLDQLARTQERFQTLAGAAPIGILEVSPVAVVTYANPRSAEITGRPIEDLMGRGWIDSVHPDDSSDLLPLIDRTHPDRDRVVTRFRVLRPDGEARHVRMSAAPRGRQVDSGYIVTVEDITEEVEAEEALTHQAFYDSLTGLPNRALFLDRLNQELARGRRNRSNIAVLFLDLDRFKIVNDSLGHETGDEVLREVGDRFMSSVRAGETAARFSGDEFIFIIREVREVEDAVIAAKRLLDLLKQPISCGNQELTVTGSIGIVIPVAGADAGMILRDADTAMYQAKDAGRNTYALFDEGLHHRSVARFEMESELRQALAGHEFEVYYQPAVEPATGQPISAEALIRWNHPTRGLVPPMEFIPVAEDTGMIEPIGRWVFEQSVSQVAAWDAAPGGPRLNVIAVNLSARQLDDPETSDMVRDVLDRYGVDSGRVAFEVTESVMMADSESARRTLEDFKELGLRLAIDDFGTGYSSLAYLHTLPVTTVKVDRSFIERLGAADDSAPVVQAIIEMSHVMGLRVVAEGVSSARLRTLVSAMGCDVAQGFFWARPMPADEFERWWLEAERRTTPLPSVS